MSGTGGQSLDTPAVGSVLGGRFRIVRRIGEGGMGVVLEAENTLTGKRVAIKWMHPQLAQQADAAQRMVREARASARVRHPNVVDVYDVVEEAGAIFLVMELLDGEPLTALLERNETKPYTTIGLILDAMRGVAAAHREGVIHRDVKPDNIFLSREADRAHPIAKVLDFGISKLTDRDGLSLTRTGMTLGTPMYMSYEQLAGLKDIDRRADVYAFGVILYEALTGQPPYTAETFSELIIKITTTEPAAPNVLRPQLPAALSSIVLRAMARDRKDRTATLDELIAQLEPFTTREGFTARVTSAEAVALGLALTTASQERPPSAATPGAMPVSMPSTAPATGPIGTSRSRASVGDGPTPFSQSVAIEDPRHSDISIPRTFTWKSALMWSALAALVIGAAAFWMRGQSVEAPHIATPATPAIADEPSAAAQPEAPKPAAVQAPQAVAPPPAPAPAPPPTASTPEPAPKPIEKIVEKRGARTHTRVKRPEDGKRNPTSSDAQSPTGAKLRAGRPQSKDF